MPATPPPRNHAQLRIDPRRAILSGNAALFIARGDGIHPDRTIADYELIVVRSGVLGIQEEERHFSVAAGEYLLLRPGRRHRGTTRYGADLSFYWIHFQPPSGGSRRFTVPQHGRIARPERCAELFQWFIEDHASGGHPPSCDLLMCQLLCEVASVAKPTATSTDQPTVLARRAQDYIISHHREAIGTARLAYQLGCNADYLGRIFRRVTGRTLTESIHQQRMATARDLLQQGSGSMASVAWACGYSDCSYFVAMFKRATGVTPLVYRRLHTRT